MKSKQTLETRTSAFPVAINFSDLGMVEEVVEEAFIKEPKKRRRKA
jgi:hypothetical protein